MCTLLCEVPAGLGVASESCSEPEMTGTANYASDDRAWQLNFPPHPRKSGQMHMRWCTGNDSGDS